MKIEHAELYTTSNIVHNFAFSTCNTVGLFLWTTIIQKKITSSREDNSTTNDSMVMKIAHAQLHMYTSIMYKFQSSTCKTVGEKLRTKLCSQTDGQADGRTDRQTDTKIAYAQLHIHTNIMCKFQSSYCKNVGVMLWITMIK